MLFYQVTCIFEEIVLYVCDFIVYRETIVFSFVMVNSSQVFHNSEVIILLPLITI